MFVGFHHQGKRCRRVCIEPRAQSGENEQDKTNRNPAAIRRMTELRCACLSILFRLVAADDRPRNDSSPQHRN